VSIQHQGADAAFSAVTAVVLGSSSSPGLFAEPAPFIILCYLAKSFASVTVYTFLNACHVQLHGSLLNSLVVKLLTLLSKTPVRCVYLCQQNVTKHLETALVYSILVQIYFNSRQANINYILIKSLLICRCHKPLLWPQSKISVWFRAWRLKRDVGLAWKIKKRAMEMIRGLGSIAYGETLAGLGLFSIGFYLFTFVKVMTPSVTKHGRGTCQHQA